MSIMRRLRRQVAMVARSEAQKKDEPIEESYFQSPAFEKELSGFNREMADVLVNAKMSGTDDKKAQSRALLLACWEKNTVTRLLPLGPNMRAARIRALTVESFRCTNFVKTCDYLGLSKADMTALARRISAALP